MLDVFDGLEDEDGRPGIVSGLASDDIEAALSAAEELLHLQPSSNTGGKGGGGTAALQPGCIQPAFFVDAQQGNCTFGGSTGDHGSNPCDESEPVRSPGAHRPPSAFTLGEAALALRLTVHEKEMELLQLRQQYMQLADQSEQLQHSLEAGLAERDRRIARLEEALGRREAAVEKLTAQLQAYQGLTPEAVAAMRSQNAALAADKRAAEAAALEATQRADNSSRRVHEGVATWERLQAELQGENARLASALQRQQSELAGLFQEKEVLQAKAAMLEARAAAVPATLLPSMAQATVPAQPHADMAALLAKQETEAVELRQRLAAALQRVDEREATARKYKEAVRALKRRQSEVEQELESQRAKQAAAAAADVQAADARNAEAAQQAAVLAQSERKLAEAKQRCEQYSRRLAESETQLQRADYERTQWEWRTKDAEQRVQAAGHSAEASSAAAARLAECNRVQVEGRASEAEAQAKAAALKAVHLEKRLAQTQHELRTLQQQYQQQQQQQQRQQHTDQQQPNQQLLAARVADLQAQLAAAVQQHASAEQSLQAQVRAKGVALAASDKKLRHLEAVLRRLAGKQGDCGGRADSFLIGTA